MVKLIVECGVNFKNLEEAKLMIKKAKEINAFLCKFQLYSDEQIKGSKDYEFLKSIMLDYNKAKELYDYGQSIEQNVFFTPMYLEAVDILEEVGVNYYKIRHKDRDNYDIYNRITQTNKPFFRSVGFLDYEIPRTHINEITLSCSPKYPSVLEDYKWTYPNFLNNGISDHVKDLSFLKQALKYKYLTNYYWERHMCLDKNCLESAWSSTFSDLKKILEVNK